jgi:hypothetical protein
MEWKNYRNEHPEIFEDMGEELEIEAELAAATRQLRVDFGLAEKALKCNQRDLRKIESDLTYLKKHGFLNGAKKRTKGGKGKYLYIHVKYVWADKAITEKPLPESQLDEEVQNLEDAMSRTKESLAANRKSMSDNEIDSATIFKKRWEVNSTLTRKCIRSRNETAKTIIKKDFVRRSQQLANGIDDAAQDRLNVFCISSTAYQKLAHERSKAIGFTHIKDTGIPDLGNWLIAATLPGREIEAEAFLEKLEGLQSTMLMWASNIGLDIKISLIKRNIIEASVEHTVDKLQKVCFHPPSQELY